MSAARRQVLIAANPKSGAASSTGLVAALRDRLIAEGWPCRLMYSLDEVQHQSHTLHRQGELQAVVSAGGDGTADALVNRLPSGVPMLIYPLGTENLLALHLGLTTDIDQACRAIAADQRIKFDVGSASGKLFLIMLSVGFDAEVVREMASLRTGHINRWSYARPIWNSLWRYRFPKLNYSIQPAQGSSWEANSDLLPQHTSSTPPKSDTAAALTGENLFHEADVGTNAGDSAAWMFVFNVPRYAASLDFCPQADPTDGLLDVCTFRRPGLARGLSYLTWLWLRRHQRLADFRHQRVARISIPSPLDRHGNTIENIPYQIDGDWGGTLPLEIETLPGRLTLLVPPAS